MTRVHARPTGANPTVRPAAPPRDFVRWDDAEETKLWILSMRSAVDDALVAGDDASRRLRRRVLSRAEVRRKLREAGQALADLIAVAERGFARVTVAPKDGRTP